MILVERHQQLSRLEELARRSSSGQGQVALLTGPHATGRTALLQAFADDQSERGALVLSAMCDRSERDLPLGMLGQLLHGAPLPGAQAEEIGQLLADASASTAEAAGAGRPSTRLTCFFHDLCLLLREVARDRLLLITVDDVEYADALSLDFLEQLIRRSSTGKIMVVLTGNDEQQTLCSPFHTELSRQPHLRHLHVAPLSPDGVQELVAHRLGSDAAEQLSPDLHAATGGNPLLVESLIHHNGAAQGGVGSYELAVLSYLQRGDRSMLDVARALAVLDRDTDWVKPHQLLDADVREVESVRQKLTEAGVFDGHGFRLDSAKAAVLEQMPAGERSALHHRAAELLADAAAPPAVVAGHLLRACTTPPAWALPALQEAAEQALRVHHPERATGYLELALEGQTEPGTAALVRARLAHTEWTINPGSVGRHLPRLTEALRAGHLGLREGLNLSRHLLWHGRNDEATELLGLIRSHAERSPETAAEMRDTEQWLAFTYPALARRRQLPSGRPAGEGRTVRPTADPWLQSSAMLASLICHGRSDEAVARAEGTLRDLHLGQHTCWVDEAALLSLGILTSADHLDTVIEWCDRLIDRETGGCTLPWRAIILASRAQVAIRRGDLTGAARHGEAALAALPLRGWGVGVGIPLGTLLLAYSRLGRFDEASSLLAQPVPDAMFQSRHGLHYLYGRGHLHLATRHYHAALADFLTCGELISGWGLDLAGIVDWRASAAEAWLRLGNQDQMRHLVSDQLSWPGSGGARSRALALRLTAAMSPAARRPSLLLEAVELLERCGDRYEQARTLADLSSAYHALDENRRARMIFRRALHMTKMCEAEPLSRELLSVSGELADLLSAGGDTDRLAVLTGSERRVAALAAMGYTNREIAGKLYITASTVEQHLTRVYRKLKINRRKDLPSDLTWHSEVAS
ncbi:helix-turn-helix transcriptional regulator [Streptomyces sp. MAR4 CNX-425]|uniref:helix-turn-helix transcriptional regulator n=1 Tax=Streptomyces sp. MAR4 CNX-425 TaxID=3406343 RepID=UPI003B5151C8